MTGTAYTARSDLNGQVVQTPLGLKQFQLAAVSTTVSPVVAGKSTGQVDESTAAKPQGGNRGQEELAGGRQHLSRSPRRRVSCTSRRRSTFCTFLDGGPFFFSLDHLSRAAKIPMSLQYAFAVRTVSTNVLPFPSSSIH